MKKIDRADITRIILETIKVAGVLSVALLAPNVVQCLAMFHKKKPRYNTGYYVKNKIPRLVRKGLVTVAKGQDGWMIFLTSKGEYTLNQYRISEKYQSRPVRWDRKWRMVIFDIPEKDRALRNYIRAELRSFGFEKWQDSVWVSAYDRQLSVDLMIAEFGLERRLRYFIVPSFDGDEDIQKMFQFD